MPVNTFIGLASCCDALARLRNKLDGRVAPTGAAERATHDLSLQSERSYLGARGICTIDRYEADIQNREQEVLPIRGNCHHNTASEDPKRTTSQMIAEDVPGSLNHGQRDPYRFNNEQSDFDRFLEIGQVGRPTRPYRFIVASLVGVRLPCRQSVRFPLKRSRYLTRTFPQSVS